jgi:CBS domain-containing protein
MKARHLMSHDAECVSAADTLEEAARRLASAGVGAMPICGEDDRLKGMLTDRDIVVKAIAKGKDVARTLVSELAEGKPVTIGADDSVSEALRTMERAQVRRLPVIDGHRLVGMISAADVARRLPRRRSGRLLEAVSQPSSRSARGRIARIALVVAPLAGAAYVMRSRRSGKPGAVRQSTTVHVPVRSAYDQWTQFEEFPSFMEGVEQVRQVDDRHLHWRAKVGGQPREWDAEITEQVPDRRVAWRSTGGKRNDGVVRFEPLGGDATRIEVEMMFEPDGIVELVGSAIGLPERRVKGDLERFRDLIERRGGDPSGAWRGQVRDEAASRN